MSHSRRHKKQMKRMMAHQLVGGCDLWGPVNELSLMVQDLAKSSAHIHKLAKLARV